MNQSIKKHFPAAETWNEVTIKYLKIMTEEYGFPVDKILYASCVCADELNYIATNFNNTFRNGFNLGGLGGLPFSGVTGIQAYGSHIPDGGAGFIFYASHVGISRDGTIGSIKRENQTTPTYSCGALNTVLDLMKRDHEFDWTTKSFKIIQTQTLELMLNGQKERIFSSTEPVIEAVNIIANTTKCLLHSFVIENKHFFTGNKVFLLGGVMINTEHYYENYLEIRDFDIIDLTE